MLFYNEDFIHFIMTRYYAGIEVTEENLKEYIYALEGSQITDFSINTNALLSATPSNVLETFSDKYLITEENDNNVDYRSTPVKEFYELQVNKNVDHCNVWIKALREIGINPWLSIRMNDCHGINETTDWRKSSFVDKHPELHIVTYREQDGCFDRCQNYALPAVQDRMLNYIIELLEKYDVEGLELDFSREIVLFPCGYEKQGRKIITEFICRIRAVLDKFEKEYNHKLKLSLIFPPSPECCIGRGMNVFDFADKIDYITIIGRWSTTDTDMPIELWKQLLNGKDIKLGGGQQLLVESYCRRCKPGMIPTITSVPMAFGQAIANLDRGCDFVYLYNYMDFGMYEGMEDWIYDECVRNDKNRPLIFNNIGERETLLKQKRSHVVTFSDVEALPLEVHSVLPIHFDKNSKYEKVRIPTGEIPENAEVLLILGVEDEDETIPDDFRVYANGAECKFCKVIKLNKHIYDKKCYAFEVKKNRFDIIMAEIKTNKKCMIEYVEVAVNI